MIKVLKSNVAVGVFVDQVTFGEAGSELWVAHLEAYPAEVLLRVRTQGHTVVLDRLSEDEVAKGRRSSRNLREIALRHLQEAAAPHSPLRDMLCV